MKLKKIIFCSFFSGRDGYADRRESDRDRRDRDRDRDRRRRSGSRDKYHSRYVNYNLLDPTTVIALISSF